MGHIGKSSILDNNKINVVYFYKKDNDIYKHQLSLLESINLKFLLKRKTDIHFFDCNKYEYSSFNLKEIPCIRFYFKEKLVYQFFGFVIGEIIEEKVSQVYNQFFNTK